MNQSGQTQRFLTVIPLCADQTGVTGYNWCDVEKAGQFFNVLNQPVSI